MAASLALMFASYNENIIYDPVQIAQEYCDAEVPFRQNGSAVAEAARRGESVKMLLQQRTHVNLVRTERQRTLTEGLPIRSPCGWEMKKSEHCWQKKSRGAVNFRAFMIRLHRRRK